MLGGRSAILLAPDTTVARCRGILACPLSKDRISNAISTALAVERSRIARPVKTHTERCREMHRRDQNRLSGHKQIEAACAGLNPLKRMPASRSGEAGPSPPSKTAQTSSKTVSATKASTAKPAAVTTTRNSMHSLYLQKNYASRHRPPTTKSRENPAARKPRTIKRTQPHRSPANAAIQFRQT